MGCNSARIRLPLTKNEPIFSFYSSLLQERTTQHKGTTRRQTKRFQEIRAKEERVYDIVDRPVLVKQVLRIPALILFHTRHCTSHSLKGLTAECDVHDAPLVIGSLAHDVMIQVVAEENGIRILVEYSRLVEDPKVLAFSGFRCSYRTATISKCLPLLTLF